MAGGGPFGSPALFEKAAQASLLSRRTPGPITTGLSFAGDLSQRALPIDSAVWVPASAGTTVGALSPPTFFSGLLASLVCRHARCLQAPIGASIKSGRRSSHRSSPG